MKVDPRGSTRGVARRAAAPYHLKKRTRRKKGYKLRKKEGKNKKITTIITNDNNEDYKWIKTDEFLRGLPP